MGGRPGAIEVAACLKDLFRENGLCSIVLDVTGDFVQDHCFHGRGKMQDGDCLEGMCVLTTFLVSNARG